MHLSINTNKRITFSKTNFCKFQSFSFSCIGSAQKYTYFRLDELKSSFQTSADLITVDFNVIFEKYVGFLSSSEKKTNMRCRLYLTFVHDSSLSNDIGQDDLCVAHTKGFIVAY